VRWILLGRIVGAHGVRGELKLESFTEPFEAILKYQPWQLRLRASEREVVGVRGRPNEKGLIIRLPEVDDRNAAELMRGAEIYVMRSVLPKPKPGEFYWVDLEGLRVRNLEDIEFGKVSHLFDTGANDVMVVKGNDDKERMIPFVMDQFIKQVDFDNGEILVDWDADF
jgi:16S rRNA processing protein RimM